MQKVLVIGAGGTIGVPLVKSLLREGKYEITLLDLKTKEVMDKLKKFKKRVNIIYGDVLNRVLVESLVSDHDYIFYLVTPNTILANINKDLVDKIEYNGLEIVVRAINYYNPKCHLFYASSTSIYNKLSIYSYLENAKLKGEKLIKGKLKNYTIYRIPLVLGNPIKDNFIYHGDKHREMDFITKEDCAYAFVLGIKYRDKLNKKSFNLGSRETLKYDELLDNVLKICGKNIKYYISKAMLASVFSSPPQSDLEDLEDIIHYQSDTLNDYYKRLKRDIKK